MSLNVLSIHGHHDFLAKFKGFKSSNLHALKGNRGLNRSMLAFRGEPNHRQGSEATDPLGLLTVNGIAKDTHLNQGHRLEQRGPLMLPRFVKTSAPENQLYFCHKIPQMAPLIVGVAHVAA